STSPTQAPAATPTIPAAAPTTPPAATGNTINVTMGDAAGATKEYRYVPNKFTFKVGEEITFVFTAETEEHTFTAEDLNVDVTVAAKTTKRVTIKFDKAGIFDFLCIPHADFGMDGQITVQ
ncbi:MAG: hypothetical protein FJ319_13795, partial [SAR202 cluster bacterium]|nr:hypothetical protein [SAR202 cluster bacterium]